MQVDLYCLARCSRSRKVLRDVLLAFFCCVFWIPHNSAIAQAQPTSGATGPDRRQEIYDILTLKFVTRGVDTAASHVKKSTSPTVSRNGSPAAEPPSQAAMKEKYVALYGALGTLNDTRGAYLEALRLYVDGRSQNLAFAQREARLDSLDRQLATLKANLSVLRAAFEPLRASMDTASPSTSFPIEDYIQSRSLKGAQADVAESLSRQELRDLYNQAAQNNDKLAHAISALLGLLKKKYPDL